MTSPLMHPLNLTIPAADLARCSTSAHAWTRAAVQAMPQKLRGALCVWPRPNVGSVDASEGGQKVMAVREAELARRGRQSNFSLLITTDHAGRLASVTVA